MIQRNLRASATPADGAATAQRLRFVSACVFGCCSRGPGCPGGPGGPGGQSGWAFCCVSPAVTSTGGAERLDKGAESVCVCVTHRDERQVEPEQVPFPVSCCPQKKRVLSVVSVSVTV